MCAVWWLGWLILLLSGIVVVCYGGIRQRRLTSFIKFYRIGLIRMLSFKLIRCVSIALFLYFSFQAVYGGKKYVSNLSTVCMKCLCHASTQCNMTVGCQKGFCGPFFLQKEYWIDAGRPTLKDDDPDRTNAFIDCAKDYTCASTAVENYMAKYGYDCDNDGVTNCDDYARLHFHLKDKCTTPIANLNYGKRYDSCKPVPSFPGSQ